MEWDRITWDVSSTVLRKCQRKSLVANQGHFNDDVGSRKVRFSCRRGQGSEMIAFHVASFRSRWLIRRWAAREGTGSTGLLECIMHAKWCGFLEITGAAPLPDEGVLRWRRGSLPTFVGGWSFSGRRPVPMGAEILKKLYRPKGPVTV